MTRRVKTPTYHPSTGKSYMRPRALEFFGYCGTFSIVKRATGFSAREMVNAPAKATTVGKLKRCTDYSPTQLIYTRDGGGGFFPNWKLSVGFMGQPPRLLNLERVMGERVYSLGRG